jgi:hypothetical protein
MNIMEFPQAECCKVRVRRVIGQGFTEIYSHLLSDPPSVFRVEFARNKNGKWPKGGHFIANVNLMPLREPQIGDTSWHPGCAVMIEVPR